jgi:DNA-binding HxlR family transcriptional regulator
LTSTYLFVGASWQRRILKKRLFSCGLEASLSVIAGKWKFLIIWHLASQPRRFGELRRLVAGITEKMLIQGLKELENDEVVNRRDFREVLPKVEYSLTVRGIELANVLRPLCEWGTENFREQIAPPQPQAYGARQKVVI